MNSSFALVLPRTCGRLGLAVLLNTVLAGTVAVSQTNPEPADYQHYGKPVAVAPADPAIAAALAEVSEARLRKTVETLVSFGTRNSLSSMETDLPKGQGITAAADWIAGEFEAVSKECGGCLEVKRDTFVADPAAGGKQWGNRIPKPTQMTNVYAILRGSDPAEAKRMYLVTGHYDTRRSNVLDDHGAAPGANDDATGVAVSLECARVLSKLKLPASLVFVAVAGEEQGLVGSAHLAHLAKEQGWQLEGVLNNDIVGGNTTPGDTMQRKDVIRVFSEGVPLPATLEQDQKSRALGTMEDSASRELARSMADVSRSYQDSLARFAPFLVARPDRYLRGGDHTSFNREGFTAVRLTEWREDYNHQHQDIRMEGGVQFGDLIQYVDFGYVAHVARLNAATLATLAASPGIPVTVALETEKLENSTTVSWKAPEGAPASAYYELLWRETTDSDWRYALRVDGTSVSVPISKDNVIFGVRAVDAGGHRGLVVVP